MLGKGKGSIRGSNAPETAQPPRKRRMSSPSPSASALMLNEHCLRAAAVSENDVAATLRLRQRAGRRVLRQRGIQPLPTPARQLTS